MNNIVDYGFREAYKPMKSIARQTKIDGMIGWE
jgi:hypothetical protein